MSTSHVPPTRVHAERIRAVKDGDVGRGPVVYWMSRDQRARDNWALLFAQDLAKALDRPLAVAVCLVPSFLGACRRQYAFMLEGLRETELLLADKRIPMWMAIGEPAKELSRLVREESAAALVYDFDPLRVKRSWQAAVAQAVSIPVFEVDAHNIVPCRFVSDKQEYAARTLRPKLHRQLATFLTSYGNVRSQDATGLPLARVDWDAAERALCVDDTVGPVTWLTPGRRAGERVLRRFLKERLRHYEEGARDPASDGLSDLSPYLHLGQISAQRVALAVQGADAPATAKEAFLEELIVRKELSDNFCLHNRNYDNFKCAPGWAHKTLDAHRGDKRPYLYDRAALERATTHDELWNAAQLEMVKRGKMHGYMRMYWAKKILEWSPTPEEALASTIYLNDRYELDGRDPNGYVGAAWSICGIHDRPWSERPVFGQIRYMNEAGCRRKFDVDAYIRRQKA